MCVGWLYCILLNWCNKIQSHQFNYLYLPAAVVVAAQTCTNLPEVLNGQYNLRECSHVDSDRVFGKVCSVQCNHGYVISQDIKWTCQSNGQWKNYDKTVFCRGTLFYVILVSAFWLLKPIGHVNVQSCLLIFFEHQSISLQHSWLRI